MPCRPFAKAALALGVAQAQTILDPLQPAFDPVDATRLACEVTVQIGHLAAQTGNRDLQRREAPLHIVHVSTNVSQFRSNRAQMLEDKVT